MTSGPGYWADTAAEAVRELNHATRGGTGLTGPADVYTVLGELALLLGRLPQAFTELQAFLDSECDTDLIAVVDGDYAGDPIAVVTASAHWLTRATDATQAARDALDQAQQSLTWAASRRRQP